MSSNSFYVYTENDTWVRRGGRKGGRVVSWQINCSAAWKSHTIQIHSFQSQGRHISPSLRTEKYFVTCSRRSFIVTPRAKGFLVIRVQQLIICSVVMVISLVRLDRSSSSWQFRQMSSSALTSLKFKYHEWKKNLLNRVTPPTSRY